MTNRRMGTVWDTENYLRQRGVRTELTYLINIISILTTAVTTGASSIYMTGSKLQKYKGYN